MDVTLTATQSAVSLAAFPKDNLPVTVIFGNQSLISRRSSSNRDSFVSLYDNAKSQSDNSHQRSTTKPTRSVETTGLPSAMPSTEMFVCCYLT